MMFNAEKKRMITVTISDNAKDQLCNFNEKGDQIQRETEPGVEGQQEGTGSN